MARSNDARREGDDFQARIFWMNAARLLIPGGGVAQVGFEYGPAGFDDVYVEYEPGLFLDHEGCPLKREFIQCKWHVRTGDFGWEDLADPAFINAEAHSLLGRAKSAWQEFNLGRGDRLVLETNHRIRRDDLLNQLIRQGAGVLDLGRLFDGKRRSLMSRLRAAWQEHLNLGEDDLRAVLRCLQINVAPSLEQLAGYLSDRLARAGLKSDLRQRSGNIYDDLSWKLPRTTRNMFDRGTFGEMCMTEKLFDSVPQRDDEPLFGVRSFANRYSNLEERCERFMDLVPEYSGRYIRDPTRWQNKVLPQLREFLETIAGERRKLGRRLRLILDVHTSLAFAAGAVLDTKCGVPIVIEQRTIDGPRLWHAADERDDPAWPTLIVTQQDLSRPSAPDVALAVGLTHGNLEDVGERVRQMDEIGRILSFEPSSRPGQSAVACGRHAAQLVEKIAAETRSAKRLSNGNRPRVHLFVAGPNVVTFFLGREHRALGEVVTYEWDFEGGGGYSPALVIPPLLGAEPVDVGKEATKWT